MDVPKHSEATNINRVAEAPAEMPKAPIASDRDDWPTLIDKANLRGAVGELARQSVLLGIEGGQIRLGIKASHHDLTAGPMVKMLEQRLGEALGRPMRANFEVSSNVSDTPAEQRVRADAARQKQAEDGIRDDPLVRSLIDDFGGRIVPNSVQPNAS